MTTVCPHCRENIDNDDKGQIGSIVKKGKCPHCNEKVVINTDYLTVLKPGIPFMILIFGGFFLVYFLQKGFLVYNIAVMLLVFLFLLPQKYRIMERELLAKGLKPTKKNMRDI